MSSVDQTGSRVLPRGQGAAGSVRALGSFLWVVCGALALESTLLLAWLLAGPFESLPGRLVIGAGLAAPSAALAYLAVLYLRRSLALETAQQSTEDAKELARHDELSGLYNVRHLRERLHTETAEVARNGGSLALILFDLDNFKDVNDRFGHLAGDALISAIGGAIRESIGRRGIAARQGGDEFAVLLPNTRRDDAQAIGVATVAAISAVSLLATPRNAHLQVGASFGVAVFPDDAGDVEALTAAADRELYRAKDEANERRARTSERHAQVAFFAIGEAIARSLDPQDRLNNLCTAVGVALDLDACAIWLPADDETLQPQAYYASDEGLVASFTELQDQEPLTRYEARTIGLVRPHPVYVDDVHASAMVPDRWRAALEPNSWLMTVPIDEPHSGMMLLLATHERSSPPDAGLAVAIGRLANAAIRNAALFTRARRQGEQLSELAGLGGLLLDGGDVADSLGSVVTRLQEITGYDMITLDTSDPSGEQPFIRAFSGRAFGGGPMDPGVERLWLTIKPTLTEPSVVTFLETLREPLVMDDPVAQAPEDYREVISRGGVRSVVVMPMTWKGALNGLLYYASYREHAFDEHDIALMHAISAQLAPSVQVACLNVELSHSYRELKDAHLQALFRLAYAAEARDPYTECHLSRIRAIAQAIARRMGVTGDELEALGYGAIVHDLGKLRIPDSILINPGSLSDDEWQQMKKHPEWGAEIIGDNAFYDVARKVALCHHERWDGTGYPNGLAGEEIPLAARVVSVADVYDALTSARPYKSAWPLERALVELMRMRGKTLCPTAVDVFMELWRDGEIGRIDAETEDEGLPFDFRDLAAA